MDWYLYPAVIIVGFAAGFINTLAGGGSAISLPFLIFLAQTELLFCFRMP